ncbi:ABC transporter permease [Arthrobacter sp. CAN_C5]|uniref:ABC transporter permease n=1 Tax=Arthrobacter sp. CAN_C5 TaxID=2760706 RepID=UPI001AE20AC5|nr:ABC transporter permease [Arthrobacter sp. CAN_C5]MBP2216720.1 peptide/nickel transport system permease protein [Arthrobacter sp. CAN_C5]
MARRILFRLVIGLGVLWGAATMTFLAVYLIPGDTALLILGGPDARPTAETLAQVRSDYLLNEPLIVQYASYLGNLLQGDLGQSYRLRIPVTVAIGQQIGATAMLAAAAAFVALPLTVLVAVLSAQRSPWVRSIVSGIEVVLAATPTFIIGFVLLIVFSFTLRWFPIGGDQGVIALILPALTLALAVFGTLSQVLRNELEDVLEQPFILTARARGMRDLPVRMLHALRHAAIPVMTLSGFVVASLFGGSVIVETLFSRQGIGALTLASVYNKDLPVIIGIVLLSAAVYVVVNLAVDLLYTLIDPKVVTS